MFNLIFTLVDFPPNIPAVFMNIVFVTPFRMMIVTMLYSRLDLGHSYPHNDHDDDLHHHHLHHHHHNHDHDHQDVELPEQAKRPIMECKDLLTKAVDSGNFFIDVNYHRRHHYHHSFSLLNHVEQKNVRQSCRLH